MADFLAIALWLASMTVLCEYGIGLADPESDEPRWSSGKKDVAFRLAVCAFAALVATFPILTMGSALAMLVALTVREVLRLLLGKVLADRPFDRELIFFLGQWLPISLWLALFAIDQQSVAPAIFGIYENPAILKVLVSASGLWLATIAGAIWVRALLDQIGKITLSQVEEVGGAGEDGESEEDDRSHQVQIRVGRIIGQLERILIFGMVMVGQWTAVGFILAAKSVARYKKLEEQSFAEYYLLGTLASTLVALATALGTAFILREVIP